MGNSRNSRNSRNSKKKGNDKKPSKSVEDKLVLGFRNKVEKLDNPNLTKEMIEKASGIPADEKRRLIRILKISREVQAFPVFLYSGKHAKSLLPDLHSFFKKHGLPGYSWPAEEDCSFSWLEGIEGALKSNGAFVVFIQTTEGIKKTDWAIKQELQLARRLKLPIVCLRDPTEDIDMIKEALVDDSRKYFF